MSALNIFKHPVTIKKYAELPELHASWRIVSQETLLPDVEMHILGAQPEVLTAKKIRQSVPDLYVHEFADIVYADGILYSPQAQSVLIDSVRTFDEAGSPHLYYGPTARVKRLGGGFYVPDLSMAEASDTVAPDHVFMPCFTSYPVYGHWLLEALTSLWAREYIQSQGGAPVKLLLSPVENVPAYMKRFVEPLGITDYDFYYPSRRMRLKRLFIPTKAYMHMAYVSEPAKAIWRQVADFYLPQATIKPVDKIYLSRGQVKTRRLENQEEIERFFEAQGFAVIHAQNLSLPDQISLFSRATHIAGPVGSAAHNVVFSGIPQQLKTFFFGPKDYSSFNAIAVIEQAFGRKACFAQGAERSKKRRSWYISLDEIRTAYEQWMAG